MTTIMNFYVFKDDEAKRIFIGQTKRDGSTEEIELTYDTAKVLIEALKEEIGVN